MILMYSLIVYLDREETKTSMLLHIRTITRVLQMKQKDW